MAIAFTVIRRFSIDYRHKRSVLRADYSKTLTYSRDIRSLGGTDPEFGPPGELNPAQPRSAIAPFWMSGLPSVIRFRGVATTSA